MPVRLITSGWARRWTDIILFKASWILLVVYQNAGVLPALFIVGLKILIRDERRHGLPLILTAFCAGVVMDMLLTAAGVYVFTNSAVLCPDASRRI